MPTPKTCLLTCALAALAFAPAAQADAPAPAAPAAQFETTFLPETIEHHYMGVQMGRLCMDRAVSFRLGDICTAIVANQMEEVSRMRTWLRDWYGTDKHPAMTAEMRAELRALARKRGRAFDRAMAKAFIEHHTVQIGRSTDCQKQAFHHDLVDMCGDQVETQSAEIKQLRRIAR